MIMGEVIDNKGNSYQIEKTLAEGGQGRTYLLQGGRYIAKLFFGNQEDLRLRVKIQFLISLHLDKNIYACPLREITAPQNGYIAEFASGMIPLTELIYRGQCDGDFQKWFLETGGLRKRYALLRELASALRSLHAKGLAYCDLSSDNVFVSQRPEKSNIFLIDLDNLRYESSVVRNIYTPRFGAPEIVNKLAPNTPSSDCFSFAVLAFMVLTTNHPLIGDYVDEGEPELEEDALAGKLPWVDNRNDTRNALTRAIPSDIMMSPRVHELFRRTFEEGLNDPMQRPSMGEWYDELHRAVSELVHCPNPECNMDFLYGHRTECPLCGQIIGKAYKIQMRRWEQIPYYDEVIHKMCENGNDSFHLQEKVYEELVVTTTTPRMVNASHFIASTHPAVPFLLISVEQGNRDDILVLTPQDNHHFYIYKRSGEYVREFNEPVKIRIAKKETKEKMMISMEHCDQPQRVLTID